MALFVFAGKLRRPDPSGLPRPRLERRLSGPQAPPVGLVLGPAGSGKTTLLSRVAAQTDVASAWYRAATEDSGEAALVAHLAQGLGAALDDQDVADAGTAGTVGALLTALEYGSTPVRLVIDDLHEIIGTAAEVALEQFCRWRPRRVQLLLGSRRPPGLNTSRLLVSGELAQLDAEDLRFRSWEVEELFRSVYAQSLSPETAAALTRRTGGWAAGLQLFHLATNGCSRLERERAVDELSGRSRLIRSYLARNVLDGLPAARRTFLLRTCTLGVLSAALCDALLGRSDSAATLVDLEQQQFFTSSTDDGSTYRYHQVLQTHLEVLLVDECGGDAARGWYARSAELLEAADLPAAALRAHARAEDWGAVARLLQHSPIGLPSDDRLQLADVPGLPRDDPGLVVANARRTLRSGRIDEAIAGFTLAESLLDDPDFQSRCRVERLAAAEWLPAPPEPLRSGEQRAVRLSRELRAMSRSVADPRSATFVLSRGAGFLLAGNAAAAATELRRPNPEAGPWERLAVGLAAEIADLDPMSDFSGAFEQIVLSADVEGLPWLARLARGWQATARLRTDPSPSRIASANDLVDACEEQGDLWGGCLLALAFGAALVLPPCRDREEPAAELLRRAAVLAQRLRAPVLRAWTDELLAAAGSGSVPTVGGTVTGQPDRRRSAAELGVRLSLGASATDASTDPVLPTATRTTGERGVRLRTLGRFEVSVDGREVPWRGLRPRARSLLMLLALHQGRGRHRESLIADLWPDATLSSGLRSLQVAVSSIRQCLASAGLAEDTVRRSGDTYALCLPAAAIDVDTFDQLVRDAARAEVADDLVTALRLRISALELYAGDLLPDVGPADWVVEERDRWRTVAAVTASDTARTAAAVGNLTLGVRAARRSLALDPYHDQAWQLLAELYERSDDHTAAAVVRRDHERICAALGL